jgi:hypothetical protein
MVSPESAEGGRQLPGAVPEIRNRRIGFVWRICPPSHVAQAPSPRPRRANWLCLYSQPPPEIGFVWRI